MNLSNEVDVVITAFGSFPGVDKNPTEELLKFIELNRSSLKFLSDLNGYVVSDLNTSVVDVSVQAVSKYIETVSPSARKRVMFHFGVDSNALSIKVETTAWNKMNFRVPDTSGFQPTEEKIESSMELDEPMQSNVALLTCIPLPENNSIILSNDPGRYLCNYIYFRSLRAIPIESESNMSLFIHIPPFHVLPLFEQVIVLDDLLEAILINFMK